MKKKRYYIFIATMLIFSILTMHAEMSNAAQLLVGLTETNSVIKEASIDKRKQPMLPEEHLSNAGNSLTSSTNEPKSEAGSPPISKFQQDKNLDFDQQQSRYEKKRMLEREHTKR